MHALKKVIGVITFAALSLSGSAVWAGSFKAKADLDSLNLVPPVFSERTGTITLTFKKPKPTPITPGTSLVAATPPRALLFNPWSIRTRSVFDGRELTITNIRLYFGQRFANGHPIATLCDNAIPGLECFCENAQDLECIRSEGDPLLIGKGGAGAISDFLFEEFQAPTGGTDQEIIGFEEIKALVKRGLIYVVVNSQYIAKVEGGTIVEYTPPECSILPSFYCKTPDGEIITDGDLRGTLR